ncbi:hypothetical protein LJB42_000063 [Komagataella kurtzmanii]|nr:hypothetical protein LJB42_000063 [Komagataella kurtzmanii]
MLIKPPGFAFQFKRLQSSYALSKCINEIFKDPPFKSQTTVNGWVKGVRVQKRIAFIDISDGTSFQNLMCVVPPDQAKELRTGVSVQVTGEIKESKGKSQSIELKATDPDSVKVLGPVLDSYPLQKKFHSPQFLRTIPHLRWKTQFLSSILRFRSHVEMKLMEFFTQEQFTRTHPPLITSSDCEGAGELFKIESASRADIENKFFGKDSYLTVSTQLHLEVLCMALSRVWTLTPCFRAEESDTHRHLSEFWMLEAEIAFISDVRQLTTFCERMIKHVVNSLHQDLEGQGANLINSRRDQEFVHKMTERWDQLLNGKWKTITYTEAIDILTAESSKGNISFQFKPAWGESLQSEHEKWLTGEYFKSPVFVLNYPKESKPFYMTRNPDGKTVACFDLLVPDVGEIIGGSMREHNIDLLVDEIKQRNMKTDDIEWYLSLRSSGSVSHGGFGMGFERLLCYLGCVENVRDVIPFPRSSRDCVC